jgi:putative hydrolase of the HAD superfamily
MGSHGIKVILFDLGGVLVTWDGVEELVALTDGRLTGEQARKYFLQSKWMNLFESGGCTPEAFGKGVVSDLDLSIGPKEFLEFFLSWDRGFEPGALELLEKLKPHFILGCLSNNNILHWTRLCKKYDMQQKFHRLYPSHETGLVKPSREVFAYVVKDIGVLAEQILFFDDNLECVENARAEGFSARKVSGVKEVERVLKELDLLS